MEFGTLNLQPVELSQLTDKDLNIFMIDRLKVRHMLFKIKINKEKCVHLKENNFKTDWY